VEISADRLWVDIQFAQQRCAATKRELRDGIKHRPGARIRSHHGSVGKNGSVNVASIVGTEQSFGPLRSNFDGVNSPELSVHSIKKRVEKVSRPRTEEKTFGAEKKKP